MTMCLTCYSQKMIAKGRWVDVGATRLWGTAQPYHSALVSITREPDRQAALRRIKHEVSYALT